MGSMALRRLLEERFSSLSTELQDLFEKSRDQGKRELADQLNQAVRRLRLCEDTEELAATLTDAAGGFAGGAALFRIEDDVARGQRIRGVSEELTDRFLSLEVPLANAAALDGSVESCDPVTAIASESEVSAAL